MEVVDKEDEDMVEDEEGLIFTQEEGNVIHLSFGSKTKGSA
jgi:hypothetical protein